MLVWDFIWAVIRLRLAFYSGCLKLALLAVSFIVTIIFLVVFFAR